MRCDATPEKSRDEIIEENKSFIYKTACRICKRKLNFENDDELSIALIAFNNACDKYEKVKGNFFSYAGVIIKNSLIDYFRRGKNNPVLTFDTASDNFNCIDVKSSMTEFEIQLENKARAEEVAALSKRLKEFDLDFKTLASSSPSHRDTRSTLLNIAFKCTMDEGIISHLNEKKSLPIKDILNITNANRKLIEKWRRYLISLIIVLSGDYPYIKSYLNIKVGEEND